MKMIAQFKKKKKKKKKIFEIWVFNGEKKHCFEWMPSNIPDHYENNEIEILYWW